MKNFEKIFHQKYYFLFYQSYMRSDAHINVYVVCVWENKNQNFEKINCLI